MVDRSMIFRAYRLSLRGVCAALSLAPALALADPIHHPTAIFAGLDKITGRIINFDVAIDEAAQFGTLQVTPRICNTRPQTEAPQTTGFVEVDEQVRNVEQRGKPDPRAEAKPEVKRIFSGWMFAASPGLHGVEHPVYDIWLVDCKGGKEVAIAPPAPAAPTADAAASPAPEGKKSKRQKKVDPLEPAPVDSGLATPPADAAGLDAGNPDPAAATPAETPKKRKKRKPRAQPEQNGPLLGIPGLPF